MGVRNPTPASPFSEASASCTEATETPDKTEPLAEILDPEKTVATYGFVWHYDHNPVLVPQEITQKDWRSDSKELVQFYTIKETPPQSSDGSSAEIDDGDTYFSTHRAGVRLPRNNEKRVTFGCRFNESYKRLKGVKVIRRKSINADGTSWPFFEDSRRLEDLALRLRDEGDEKAAEFSEEEALRLVHRKTPEPYEIEETPEVDDVTEIEDDTDFSDLTNIEEGSEILETPELEDVWGFMVLFSDDMW
ncbi:hypothetical protein HO133_000638 [Letharia lupina]|uniref:Uncharacterized protein n=1 Tax=Letharia lupina TaxID=560253 RepID=A0A8H6FBR7_9LECA|nr:uncharacterized protein HO133_000638 [Letharia lupina]KAF6222592.1 hypothetical protein HO133_000638 [Letharia lupina]